MKEGWICPNCGRVWAPWIECCDCAKGYVDTFTTGIPEQPQRPNTGDPIPPDHYNTCGSVESVTKAPEVCPNCDGAGFVVASFNDGDKFIGKKACPVCNPPVDDSLTKARIDENVANAYYCLWQAESHANVVHAQAVMADIRNAKNAFTRAIDERDAAMSQMMTAEEIRAAYDEWPGDNSFCSYLIDKIRKAKKKVRRV